MIPELFKIGPITINSFGVMAMLGFLVPAILLRKEIARFGKHPDFASSIIIAAMLGGLVGARIYFIVERWDIFYADSANRIAFYAMIIAFAGTYGLNTVRKKEKHWSRTITISSATALGVFLLTIILHVLMEDRTWSQYTNSAANLVITGAGLVWYGGLIGGIFGVYLFVKQQGFSFPTTFDLMAPLLLLGQTFGRMGCLLSGDGDYGPPTDVPWAMSFPNALVPTHEFVHPTPIYDMIWLFASFLLVWNIRKKELPTGAKVGIYFLLVGVGRIITEFFRTTPKVLLGLTAAQLISVAFMIAGIAIFVSVFSKSKKGVSIPKNEDVKASKA